MWVFVVSVLMAFVGFVEANVDLMVANRAHSSVDVFWLDLKGKGEIFLLSVAPHSEQLIHTFANHEFALRLRDSNSIVKFRKSSVLEEKIYVVYDQTENIMTVLHEEPGYPQSEDRSLNEIIGALSVSCANYIGEKLHTCIEESMGSGLSEIHSDKERMEDSRNYIADRLRNYTCADESLQTSPSIDVHEIEIDHKTYIVNTLLNFSHAKIYYVDNFVSDEECDTLVEFGGPRLQRATVAGDDGMSTVSESRKAQQASYLVHQFKHEGPLWPLYNRVLNMTNIHTGLNLEPPGQENFVIIQYNPSDEYRPHCDGSCKGERHISTGRVATAVLYCRVPSRGGATTFTKADVLVKAKKGTAVFFSYIGEDGKMDDGYTEHSGCPVLEGEKWITTAWMRLGVSKEKNSANFDPSGFSLL